MICFVILEEEDGVGQEIDQDEVSAKLNFDWEYCP